MRNHEIRVNSKGELTIPFSVFRNIHPDEIWKHLTRTKR